MAEEARRWTLGEQEAFASAMSETMRCIRGGDGPPSIFSLLHQQTFEAGWFAGRAWFGEADVEKAAKASVEWEADKTERDTEGMATLDRWDALDAKAKDDYRSEMRSVLAAVFSDPGVEKQEVPDV